MRTCSWLSRQFREEVVTWFLPQFGLSVQNTVALLGWLWDKFESVLFALPCVEGLLSRARSSAVVSIGKIWNYCLIPKFAVRHAYFLIGQGQRVQVTHYSLIFPSQRSGITSALTPACLWTESDLVTASSLAARCPSFAMRASLGPMAQKPLPAFWRKEMWSGTMQYSDVKVNFIVFPTSLLVHPGRRMIPWGLQPFGGKG